MKITPLDIRNQEFSSGLSGYNRKDVKNFLEQVADQLEQALLKNNELNSQIEILKKQNVELRETEDELKRTVLTAERIATELKQNAQREAEIILREAEAERERAVRDAENERERAMRGVAETTSAAEQKAIQIVQEAQQHKERLFNETREQQQKMRMVLDQVRLEKEQFISQYQAMLRSFLDLSERYKS